MVLQRMLGLTVRAAGVVVGASLGATSGSGLAVAASGATSTATGRVHLPVRGGHTAGAEPHCARLEEMLLRHDAVSRAEVNGVLGRIMVEYDTDALVAMDIPGLVRAAEHECALHAAPSAPLGATHPAEPLPVLREAVVAALLERLAVRFAHSLWDALQPAALTRAVSGAHCRGHAMSAR